MPDTEDIITNTKGGKQSKIYRAYHLIDPWALECLAAIHHRGAIKYATDNWRNISTEDHLNHAMHHMVQALKTFTMKRLSRPYLLDREDHLAHALCRLTFAIAMEVDIHGPHTEHSDPTYHEPKATSTEPTAIRNDGRGVGPIPPTEGFHEGARGLAAIVDKIGRNNPERASSARSSYQLGIGKAPVHRDRRRR